MARALLLAAALAALGCRENQSEPGSPVPAPALELLADFNIAPGTVFEGIGSAAPFGGISAVVYDEERELWVALSDARRSSRLYELAVTYGEGALTVTPVRSVALVDEAGEPFPENVLDPEGLVLTPRRSYLVATEPDRRKEPAHEAKLLSVDLEGRLLRAHDVPAKFLSSESSGMRHNVGFESLTLSPSGTRLFAGVEGALDQDGPRASFDRPGFCRIVAYDVSGDDVAPRAEYVYPIGPLAAYDRFPAARIETGLVELLALSDEILLALERDYIVASEDGLSGESANRARLYRVDLAAATDVSAVASLEDTKSSFLPARKELVLDFDDIVSELSPGFQRLDNFEAMGIGPVLESGWRSLLVVSDDNFGEHQRSAFLMFRFKPETDVARGNHR